MYCGVHCLTFVARRDGIKVSRARASALAGTNRNGTRPDGMMGALTALGYRRARLTERMTWGRLRQLSKNKRAVLIVAWWSDLDAGARGTPSLADGHYSVVLEMTHDTITLYDPDVPEPRVLPREFFMARWYDWFFDADKTRRNLPRGVIIAYAPKKQDKLTRVK